MISFMREDLLLTALADTAFRPPARIIPIGPVIKKNNKQKEETPKIKAEIKTPLFYTEPIFQPKEHDCL